MRISDLLHTKGTEVVSMPADATVRELIATLVENGIGAVPVVDGPTLLGVVSERDVVRHLHTEGDGVLGDELSQLMTADVVSCGPEDNVDDVATTMTEQRIRHLPVLVDGRLAGIVSIGDVVKGRIAQLETASEQLEHYITG